MSNAMKQLRTDTASFISRLIRVNAWRNYRNIVFKKEELMNLAEDAKEHFQNEPILARINPPVLVVGDIHGQYYDLIRILNTFTDDTGKTKKVGFFHNRFVFLGDYVDRGQNSVATIALLFALKLHYPQQYVLLRGNHETKTINFAYGFREELIIKIGEADGHAVWEKFNEAFAYMPLVCVIGRKILCMHGGISPKLENWKSLESIQRPLVDVSDNALAQDLVWADPASDGSSAALSREPVWSKNATRGLSCTFNSQCVNDVCKTFEIELIVRAHQMIPDGFKFFAGRKLVTIFSAPRYMDETDNRGAIMNIRENGSFGFIIFDNSKKGGKNPLEDELTRADDIPNVSARRKSDAMINSLKSTELKAKKTKTPK
ncbi:hypothetical protein GCK72_015154 [Caenorhabditis remanei]|uniref:Serine/threonine-protein phosphatase n=1 Tax=Caenorhabditis remanei TaxID=31234 RepID=A0A6A5GVL2_CAERE|nr:hypothetical protein GCK72_015154 [Caenorhabditis remanei]KAF1758694.1 hypothetical protein GCK72_015154 [Caenorhabditis remanei]